MKYLAADNRLVQHESRRRKGLRMNSGLTSSMVLDYGLRETLALSPERKFSTASSTVGREAHHQPHFSGFESFSLDEKICTFGRHPMYTWFIVEISRPIITQPLREVLKSLTLNTWERTEMKCMSLWFIFLRTKRNDREPIFQDEREETSEIAVSRKEFPSPFVTHLGCFYQHQPGNNKISDMKKGSADAFSLGLP